jgi:hypothetical protein
MPADRLTYDDAIALTDAELEERLSSRLGDIDDDDLHGELCVLLDELTERHAPDIARMSIERVYAAAFAEENMEAMRQREAARMIRSALEGESD